MSEESVEDYIDSTEDPEIRESDIKKIFQTAQAGLHDYESLRNVFMQKFNYDLPDITEQLDTEILTKLGSGAQGVALKSLLPFEVSRDVPDEPLAIREIHDPTNMTVLKIIDVSSSDISGFNINEIIPYIKLHCSTGVFQPMRNGTYRFVVNDKEGPDDCSVEDSPIPCLRWLAFTNVYRRYPTNREIDGPPTIIEKGSFIVMAMTLAEGMTLSSYKEVMYEIQPNLYTFDLDSREDRRVPHPIYNVLVILQLMRGLFYGLLRIHQAEASLFDVNGNNVIVGGPDFDDSSPIDIVIIPESMEHRLIMKPVPRVTYLDFGNSCSEIWGPKKERIDTCTFRNYDLDDIKSSDIRELSEYIKYNLLGDDMGHLQDLTGLRGKIFNEIVQQSIIANVLNPMIRGKTTMIHNCASLEKACSHIFYLAGIDVPTGITPSSMLNDLVAESYMDLLENSTAVDYS